MISLELLYKKIDLKFVLSFQLSKWLIFFLTQINLTKDI